MATKDRFLPNDPIPLFLSEHGEDPERSGIWKIVILMTIGLVFSTVAIGFAIAPVRNPLALYATASQIRTSPQDFAARLMPTLQSTATAQALPPTREAPTGDELIAAFKNAFEGKAEVNQPPAKALFNQFQAWAVEEDAQAQVGPPRPVRDARAQVVKKARAPVPKRRPIQSEQTALTQGPSPSPVRSFDWRNKP